MNGTIMSLLVRVNGDITLSESAKITITHQLEQCSSEEEFDEIRKHLELYWSRVDPIIQGALKRKTPEELMEIEIDITRMITDTHKIVEKSSDKSEKIGANMLLSDI